MGKWRVFGGMFKVKVVNDVHDWHGAVTLPLRKTAGCKARFDPGALSTRDKFWLAELGSQITEEPLLTHYIHFQHVCQLANETLPADAPFTVAVGIIRDLFALHGATAPTYAETLAALQSGSMSLGAATIVSTPMPELFPLTANAVPEWGNGSLKPRHNPAFAWSSNILTNTTVVLPAALRADHNTATPVPLWLAPVLFGPGLKRSKIGTSFTADLDPVALSRSLLHVAAHGISITVPRLAPVLHMPCDHVADDPSSLSAAHAAALCPMLLGDMRYYRMSGAHVFEFHGRPTKRARPSPTGQFPPTAADALRMVKAAFAWAGQSPDNALVRSIVDGCRPSIRQLPRFADGVLNDENLLEVAALSQTATVRDFFDREAKPYTASCFLDVDQICGIASITRAVGVRRCAHTGWASLRKSVDCASPAAASPQLHVFIDREVILHFSAGPDPLGPAGPWCYDKSVVVTNAPAVVVTPPPPI